jgi:hypothetical protein
MKSRNLNGQNGEVNESITRLGVILKEFVDSRIQPNHKIFEFIVQILEDLLPVELMQQCKVSSISGGQLKILVSSPCYMYELSLCSSNLLAELQQRCPQARLKEIKFAIG